MAEKSNLARAAGPNKHQLRTEDTKRKLLDAAAKVFTRDGFEAARLEEIAAEAGFTRGAFYAHFASKTDLFFALLEAQASKGIQELSRVVAKCETLNDRKEAVRAFYLKRSNDREWAILNIEFKLYAVRHAHLQEEIAAAHRGIRNKITGWLRESLNNDLTSTGKQNDCVRIMLEAAFNGLVLERAYDPKRLSDIEMRDLLGKIFDAFAHLD